MVQIVVLEVSQGGLYSGPGNKNFLGTAIAMPSNKKTTSKAQIKTKRFIFLLPPTKKFSSLKERYCNAFIQWNGRKP